MRETLKRLSPILLVLACLLPFLPGLGGPFLHDDSINLAMLKVGPFNLQSALDAAFRNESGLLRRPLSNLSLAANLWLHDRSPFGFKLFNLLLHGACGLVLLAFLRAVLEGLKPGWGLPRRNWIALLAAMLWVIHPLQVSTTLYVVQRMAQWPTLFLFLLGWRFQAYMNRGNFTRPANLRMLAAWIVLLVLALASKENGALAPLLMGVQWTLSIATRPASGPPRWMVLAMSGLPLLVGAVLVASQPDFILGGYAGREFTPAQRLMTETVVLWHYLRLWFVPWLPWMGLYTDMPTFGITDTAAWLAAGTWLALAGAAVGFRARAPLFAFAVLWFLAAHAMESTLLPLELMYEHRNYLALPGMALLVAACIEGLSHRFHIRLPLLAAPLLLLLGGATLHRAHTWSSPDMFAFSEYAHHPTSERAVMMMLSRDVAVRNSAGTTRLLDELKNRNPEAVWSLLLDAALQCGTPNHVVDWQRLDLGIRQQGSNMRVVQLMRHVAVNRISGQCPYLQIQQFTQAMESGYLRALAEGNRLQVELYGTYLAWLARSGGNEDLATRWFMRAATAAPTSTEPLFDLAYLQLNRGELGAASTTIAELRHRQASNALIGYRIDELDGFLAQERAAHPSH